MEIKILEQKSGRPFRAISAIFKKDNEWYYADLADLPLYGIECMIFPANENGEVTDWSEVYCNRPMSALDEDSLRLCIEDFCSE